MILRLIYKRDYILSILLAILSLFYIVKLLAISNIVFISTYYRVSTPIKFDPLIDPLIDSIVIVSLTSVIAIIALYKKYKFYPLLSLLPLAAFNIYDIIAIVYPLLLFLLIVTKRIEVDLKLYIKACIYILLIIEALSLLRWITYPIYPTKIYSDYIWYFSLLEARLFYAFGSISLLLLFLLISSFLYKKYLKVNNLKIDEASKVIDYRILLILSIALAIILPIYPYIPTINSNASTVSVDEKYYLQWLEEMNASNDIFRDAFSSISKGDRPLTLLLLYALEHVGLYDLTVRVIPIILSISLVIVTYYLIRAYTNNRYLASLSGLFSILSYHFVVGMYAGFFANWLALLTSYLAILALLKAWNTNSMKWHAIFFIMLILTLLLHVYTWSYLVATISLFIIISYILNRRLSSNAFIIIMLLVSSIVVDVTKMSYFHSAGGLERDLIIGSKSIGIEEYFKRWSNLSYTFNIMVGGFFTNSLLLLLSLVWIIKTDYRDPFARVIMASIFISVIPMLFGNITMQTRFLYNMPLHIPASIITYSLMARGKALPILIIIHMLNYTFRSLANMYLILPEGAVT